MGGGTLLRNHLKSIEYSQKSSDFQALKLKTTKGGGSSSIYGCTICLPMLK